MYDNSFSNFGRPLVPDDSGKDSAPRYARLKKIFNGFYHMGMAATLVNGPQPF